jgi:hypothetical protein
MKLKPQYTEVPRLLGDGALVGNKEELCAVFDPEMGEVRVYGDWQSDDGFTGRRPATADNWREQAHAELTENRQKSPWVVVDEVPA